MKISPPAAETKIRTLVFSFDEKYAKYFSVVLASLTGCADKNCFYDLIVLHDGLKEQTVRKLQKLVPDGFMLRFFDVGSFARDCFGDLSGTLKDDRWAVPIYYDLLIPLIMPEYERVLYCDSDIVFREDPGPLFEMDPQGCSLIAVRDLFSIAFALLPEHGFLCRQRDVLRNSLGIEDPLEYFNSGVVLYCISSIDREAYLGKVRKALLLPDLPAADQDVLNAVFSGDVSFAPFRFNMQVSILRRITDSLPDTLGIPGVDDYLEAAKAPAVIHYSTEEKPWLWPEGTMSEDFWEEARKTPFYRQILLENIGRLHRLEKLRLWKYAAAAILGKITRGRAGRRFRKTKRKHRRLYLLAQKLCAAFLCLTLVFSGCDALTKEGSSAGRAVPPSVPEAAASIPREGRVLFSSDSGTYEEDGLTVCLSAPEGYTVAFTRDGSIPTAEDDSGLQSAEIELRQDAPGYLIQNRSLMVYPDFADSFLLEDPTLPEGCVLRAAAVSPAGEIGPVETKVYFSGVDFASCFPGCLVLSIVADPADLLDYETGILAAGALYDAWRSSKSARRQIKRGEIWEVSSNATQHGKAWERPCILQIYDGGNAPSICTEAGIRVAGGVSRTLNQKSFNIYFRESYGEARLRYELIDGIGQYKSFRLFSGGNNADWLKFKDAFLRELVSDRDFDVAGSRSAVLFLNGEYWGPYLLTEKLSAQMMYDHHGVDRDQVIIVKEGEIEEGEKGDIRLYEQLMSYAQKDLADETVWREFCGIMDVRSMADYCAVRIYFGDADWGPDKNDVLWRTRDDSFNGGRWRYILHDVEYSTGMYGAKSTAAKTDHVRIAAERYPLFAAAMRNPEFLALFLDSLREIGSINCDYETVISTLQPFLDTWEPLMPEYYKRFGGGHEKWDQALDEMEDFFRVRYARLLPRAERYIPA